MSRWGCLSFCGGGGGKRKIRIPPQMLKQDSVAEKEDLAEEDDDGNYQDIQPYLAEDQSDEVVTPQKLGNVFVYDNKTPTMPVTTPDYDVPPSRNRNNSNMDTQGNFDSPSPQTVTNSDTYDVLPKHRNSEGYDSNRSSVMSTGSGASMSTSASNTSFKVPSRAGSDCGFETSPTDVYDVPPNSQLRPSRKPSNEFQTNNRNFKLNNDTYDVPTKRIVEEVDSGVYDTIPNKLTSDVNKNNKTDFYDRPGRLFSSSLDGGCDSPNSPVIKIDDHDYDLPVDGASKPIPEEESELYDTLPNKSLVKNNLSQQSDSGSVYDIPPQVTRDIQLRDHSLEGLSEQIRRMSTSSYDSSRSSDLPNIPYEELPIELEAAMDLLIKVQQDLTAATSRLLGYIHSSWRRRENLEPILYELKQSCVQFHSALTEFVSFGQGALANSTRAADKNLVRKLYKSLQPILECHQTVTKAIISQNEANWYITGLVQDVIDLKSEDDLNSIMTCARNVSIDLRTLVSVIQGNSSLLFKRVIKYEYPPQDGVVYRSSSPNRSVIQERPLPTPPSKLLKHVGSPNISIDNIDEESPSPVLSSTPIKQNQAVSTPVKSKKENAIDDDNDYENDSREWLGDTDYVELEWKEKMERKLLEKRRREAIEKSQALAASQNNELENSDIKNSLTPNQKEQYEKVALEALKPVDTNVDLTDDSSVAAGVESQLTAKDKQLLLFYSTQILAHSNMLTNAIEAFLNCVEYNHPPKIFVAHSKFVVLNAHKIVYIGDTLTRSLVHQEIKNKVMLCANHLCECLKQTVMSTKSATYAYPSVTAVQEMVDRVVDVSHSVNEMKQIITKGASL